MRKFFSSIQCIPRRRVIICDKNWRGISNFAFVFVFVFLFPFNAFQKSNLWQQVYEKSPTSNGCAVKVFVAAVYLQSNYFLNSFFTILLLYVHFLLYLLNFLARENLLGFRFLAHGFPVNQYIWVYWICFKSLHCSGLQTEISSVEKCLRRTFLCQSFLAKSSIKS